MDFPEVLLILASAAATSVLGAMWYHPRVFGAVWVRAVNATPEMVEKGVRRSHIYAIAALFAGIVLSAMMHYLLVLTGAGSAGAAVMVGFFAWAGFILPALLGQLLWEQKPAKLFLVNAGYWLLSCTMVALILFY